MKHITDDHSDENQSPEDVLRCPLCEAIFYHLDAYELHITFHSTDDLYSEENEMFKDIIEFSLETVPPIIEKVEDCRTQDAESTMNAVGIDNFLQLVIGGEGDNEQHREKVKSKKHKKHKKSKKAAITLDEFLNMNKDVFGEGIDFEGIEEVPSQVVTKQLKGKKQLNNSKVPSSKELDKLKKQGIIVKTKPGKPSTLKGVKFEKDIPVNKPIRVSPQCMANIKPVTKTNSSNVICSDEVLSKLISQSNNQIKIVKKQAHDVKSEIPLMVNTENLTGEIKNKQESTEKDTDITKIDKVKEEETYHCKEKDYQCHSVTSSTNQNDESNKVSELCNTNEDNLSSNSKYNMQNNYLSDEEDEEEIQNDDNIHNEKVLDQTAKSSSPVIHQNIVPNSVYALKNISQQITIKSLSPNKLIENYHKEHSDEEQEYSESENADKKTTKNNSNSLNIETTQNSFNSLKHLSHLTIKSINQLKNEHDTNSTTKDLKLETGNANNEENLNEISPQIAYNIRKDTVSKHELYHETSSEKSSNALKNIRKHITIKSFNHLSQSKDETFTNNSDDEEMEDLEINSKLKEYVLEDSQNDKIIKRQVSCQPIRVKNMKLSISREDTKPENYNETKKDDHKNQSVNLLKRLTNITAKPVKIAKNESQIHTNQSLNVQNKEKNFVKEVTEETEIFNIDDSDSEEETLKLQDYKDKIINTTKQIHHKNSNNHSNNSLQSVNRNITIKPTQQKINKDIEKPATLVSNNVIENSNSYHYDYDTKNHNDISLKETLTNKKDLGLKQALKTLGKQITVKSRTSSPNLSIKYQDHNTSINQAANEQIETHNDDSDSNPSNVKICELKDNFSDNEEFLEEENGHSTSKCNSNVIIQSPDTTNSSDNLNDKVDTDELADIESQIKMNTLPKLNSNSDSSKLYLSSLKNINKNLTIKPLKNSNFNTEDVINSPNILAKVTPEIPMNLNKELSIKPLKQIKTIEQEDCGGTTSKIQKPVVGHSTIQSASNQKITTSTNQVNTVNKEVTVQTFQRQTVIEEITTTVTKRVRTVNQTIKQEVRNTNQNTSNPTLRPQKVIQRVRPNQQIKNFQGITVRQPSPTVGTKIRNSSVPVRPAAGNTPRPMNQIVPVRPGLNLNTNTQRLSTPNKINPSASSQQKPLNTIKPLKIGPNAMNPPIKRSASDEVSGPFSCFKKPKESLIPVSDVPSFSSNPESEATIQFASASRMSKLNFTSTTNTVKGVKSCTQIKTEASCSSQQQLSKLGNITGLKIAKTSHAKQAIKIEEKSENSTTKRTTLEAIEKLQKQGLLVKKPCLDVSEHFEQSNSGSDND